ncbi:MAG TPA: flagellar biosynthetic protein FliO [Anaerolineaceae bacterium]|nr:flagellar biosynthetic protein FliO [Anaerolineaceae bacterium]HPN52810.1 flagellar biosynthetic protein FliO [Anaerolineaceae bacterium]
MPDFFQKIYARMRTDRWFAAMIWLIAAMVLLGVVILLSEFSSPWVVPGDETTARPSMFESFGGAVSTLFRVLLVFGLLFLTMILLQRWKGGGGAPAERRMKLMETLHLSPRQSIYLVRVGEKEFMVGGTDSGMHLLAELDPKVEKPGEKFAPLLERTMTEDGERRLEG